ncbi:MAG: BtpA/SgcQ family protein [Myxococcales bacterium]|nr:BtpA/SgcQ family protein [Myxococcales bacterium]
MKPLLVGVIHLPPLPGSPRASLPARSIAQSAATDAAALVDARFDAVIVENFGDAPFFATRVPAITVAAMTVCVAEVLRATEGRLAVGVNVLRNDGESAIAVAAATGASFVRINVLSGARVTDQGVVEGRAAETMRLRRALGAEGVEVWADVDVKHSAPLGASSSIDQEVHDVVERGLASAVLVTGEGTGKAVDEQKLARVARAAGGARVLVASGATIDALPHLARSAGGVIVGTALRVGDRPGGPIDRARAAEFAHAFRAAYGVSDA